MSRYAIRSSLAGLALVLGTGLLAAPGMAATEAGDASQRVVGERGHHGKHDHRHGPRMMMRDGLMIPGVGPVSKKQLEALKLNADQQAKLDAARQAQRQLFDGHRESGKSRHELLDKQLADGKLDPRALLAAEESGRDAFRKQADAVRDQWLAVWDSLDDTQRGQVAGFVKENQARMKAHFEKRAKRGDRGDRSGQPAEPAVESPQPANAT